MGGRKQERPLPLLLLDDNNSGSRRLSLGALLLQNYDTSNFVPFAAAAAAEQVGCEALSDGAPSKQAANLIAMFGRLEWN